MTFRTLDCRDIILQNNVRSKSLPQLSRDRDPDHVTHEDLERLYSSPGLREYYPEAVLATTLEGQSLPALCYNLREKPGRHEENPEYAGELRAVLGKFNFPSDYIESIS
ncbi:MAG: hypothetical protein WBM41_15135 [Arenicellales bacterium]